MNKFFVLLIFVCSIYSCKSSKKIVITSTATFDLIKKDPIKLKQFIIDLPKGADIHHHASGSPFAEEYIDIALKDSLFINPITYQLYRNLKSAHKKKDSNSVLINDFVLNASNKQAIIENWSVENYKQNGRSGHTLFFNSFSKFKAAFVGHETALLSAICKRAKNNKISYIETMIRVPNIQDSVALLSDKNKWNLDSRPLLEKLNATYLNFEKKGIDRWAQANADSLDAYQARVNHHGITLRFQTYGVRVSSNQSKIFSQLILAFKTAQLTPNLVGVNFVSPEDHKNSLTNYNLHMQMFAFLNKKFPKVNIALHAGELVAHKGDVSASDLKFHIHDAITIAKAKRIGHGVDLTQEQNWQAIVKKMKLNNIAIEINLRSNEVILDRNKENHPIKSYLNAGVAVIIATDDEGVLRTNIQEQYHLLLQYVPNLDYHQLKNIIYNSISYSFLEQSQKRLLLNKLDLDFVVFENKYFKSL